MTFVTVTQIIEHTGRSRSAVERAMKAASVKAERRKGIKGIRITLKEANRFIALQWPDVPQINLQNENQ